MNEKDVNKKVIRDIANKIHLSWFNKTHIITDTMGKKTQHTLFLSVLKLQIDKKKLCYYFFTVPLICLNSCDLLGLLDYDKNHLD